MVTENPRNTLIIVFCGSMAVYTAIAVLLLPFLMTLFIQQGDVVISLFQVGLGYLVLFLVLLLPSSYVYWRHRVDVKVLGPEPAVAEPGDEITLMVAIGFPDQASPKGAVLEAFIGNFNVATEKVEGSPTQLNLRVPEINPGYHKISTRVSQEGYFTSTSDYELLIIPPEEE